MPHSADCFRSAAEYDGINILRALAMPPDNLVKLLAA